MVEREEGIFHDAGCHTLMKRRLLFEGTATALVTPFKPNGTIDEPALRDIVDRQLKGGIEALVPVGSTGEGATLTEDEQAFVIETVAEQVNGRVPVIGGASSNSTTRAIGLAKQAQKHGADAILTVAPFYNKPTQEGLFRHFGAIAAAVDIPVVIYNVPGRTASNIEAGTALRIAEEFPSIAGVKEASANFPQIMEILRNRPQGFGVWSGDDNLTLPMVALGADGVISVVANEIPRLFSDMVRHALGGKWEKARTAHFRLLPLMNANFLESNPIPVKAALAMMGLIQETLRLPLIPMTSGTRKNLQAALQDLKLVP
jgi:4-hydroxy-tetrahydrodipicolinate synthase